MVVSCVLGSIMCVLLSALSVLQCSEADWDVGGVASSSRHLWCWCLIEQTTETFRFQLWQTELHHQYKSMYTYTVQIFKLYTNVFNCFSAVNSVQLLFDL